MTHFVWGGGGRKILIGVEMDRRKRGYTTSGESRMDSILLTHIFWGLPIVASNNIRTNSRGQNMTLTTQMSSTDPPKRKDIDGDGDFSLSDLYHVNQWEIL